MKPIIQILLILFLLCGSVFSQSEYLHFGKSGFEVSAFYNTTSDIQHYGLTGGFSIGGAFDLGATLGRVSYDGFTYYYYSFEPVSSSYDTYGFYAGYHPLNKRHYPVRLAITASMSSSSRDNDPTAYSILPYVHTDVKTGHSGYLKLRLGFGYSDISGEQSSGGTGVLAVGGTVVINSDKESSITFHVQFMKSNTTNTIGLGIGLLFSGRR